MSTIFSKIIKGEIPSYKIAEDEQFFAFLDINPMGKGHTLVVPKVEIDYIFDLDDKLLADMIIFSRKVAAGIKAAIPCNRIGMMTVGLDVPHVNIHLIPITEATDMSPAKPKLKLSKEEFEAIAKSIRESIEL